MLSSLEYIDLFAGIGGFHQAMDSVGATCVFASEWDKDCQYTYEENYGISPHGDITQIDEKDIPVHDILCAGFPCQAFSISGKQKGFEDSRGTLFFEIARIARYHQPKILLLENVRNFEKHNNGNTLRTVKTTLEEIGYDFFSQVLNASYFGVPHRRERVFMVAFRKDLNVHSFTFPSGNNIPVILQEFLDTHTQHTHLTIQRDDIKFKENVKITQDMFGNYPQKPIRIGTVNKGGQGERIYSPLGHAITLSAYGGGVGAKTGLYQIDNIIRRLSPDECRRITGFSEDFKLHPKPTISYRQFGNSVVVNVLKAILQQIIDSNILNKQTMKVAS
jgi:DNA (cytosine-5)-methyltransferase 1